MSLSNRICLVRRSVPACLFCRRAHAVPVPARHVWHSVYMTGQIYDDGRAQDPGVVLARHLSVLVLICCQKNEFMAAECVVAAMPSRLPYVEDENGGTSMMAVGDRGIAAPGYATRCWRRLPAPCPKKGAAAGREVAVRQQHSERVVMSRSVSVNGM